MVLFVKTLQLIVFSSRTIMVAFCLQLQALQTG